MENIKTLVFGLPCGGSSFTYKIIEKFLRQQKPNLTCCHEPSMIHPITFWWSKFDSFEELDNNFNPALNQYNRFLDRDLIKVNYYTRFLNKNFIQDENLIFVVRAPWQWAKSSLSSRFNKNYFFWMTKDNKNLNEDPYKHLIDLWIEIYNQVLDNIEKYDNKVLYLNYYDYVNDYKFIEKSLNNFYQFENYINIEDYTNKQLVRTNKRRSKGETIKDIDPNYKDYRLDEIKNIYSNFKIKLDV